MSLLSDITDCLMNYADMEGFTTEQLQPYCDAALSRVRINLKPGITEDLICWMRNGVNISDSVLEKVRLRAEKYQRKNAAKEEAAQEEMRWCR